MIKIILFLSCLGILIYLGLPESVQTFAQTSTPYSYLRVKPFNRNSIVYRCEDIGGGRYRLTSTSDSISTPLIDITSMSVSDCSFTCTVASDNSVPLIGIKFMLEPAGSSPLVEGFGRPINFETSVAMRNYKR